MPLPFGGDRARRNGERRPLSAMPRPGYLRVAAVRPPGIGAHLPVRAGTDDQMLRKFLTDVFEIIQDESVSVCTPPVGEDLPGHDIARLLFAVDDEAAEAVALEPRQASPPLSASVQRSVRAVSGSSRHMVCTDGWMIAEDRAFGHLCCETSLASRLDRPFQRLCWETSPLRRQIHLS